MTAEEKLPDLIHFFGPDGSGKSTQANMLVLHLQNAGLRVKKCWLRSPHTLAFLLWRVLIKIGFYRVVVNPFGTAIKFPAVNRSKTLRSWWSIVEFISVLPPLIRIKLLMTRGYKLVADRFILDTVTSIAWFTDDPTFLSGTISKQLFRFMPQKTTFIFLDSDYTTIFNRREHLYRNHASKTQRREQGLILKTTVEPKDFINFQRRCYTILAKNFHALVTHTETHTIEQTHDIIINYLFTKPQDYNIRPRESAT